MRAHIAAADPAARDTAALRKKNNPAPGKMKGTGEEGTGAFVGRELGLFIFCGVIKPFPHPGYNGGTATIG